MRFAGGTSCVWSHFSSGFPCDTFELTFEITDNGDGTYQLTAEMEFISTATSAVWSDSVTGRPDCNALDVVLPLVSSDVTVCFMGISPIRIYA